MGRKSSAKAASNNLTPTPPPPRSKAPVVVGLILVALVVGVFAYMKESPAEQQAGAASQIPDRGPIPADLKPHPQENLPPLEFPAYPMARSPEAVRAAYRFAAEHPEVLSYVPCFCGCERHGHGNNQDCFVAQRDSDGRPVWSPHGVGCGICIDVAREAARLHGAGANVAEIREAIDRKYRSEYPTSTATPAVPATSSPQ